MNEFDLIERFFTGIGDHTGVVVGVGDDAAIIDCNGNRLALASDTMVAGVHLPADAAPECFGYRLAAVNLSDFAAIGARPRWATLALTVPDASAAWFERFAAGLREALGSCALVGGDTTRGPLTASLQLVGELGPRYLPRGGASVGDIVLVSGTLGDARAGLEVPDATPADTARAYLRERYYRPTPRVELGCALTACASAAIDVSDGLLADLAHIATASRARLEIEAAALPLSASLLAHTSPETAIDWAAGGGDDYELAFTVPPAELERARALAREHEVPISVIGRVTPGSGVVLLSADGAERPVPSSGYRHF